MERIASEFGMTPASRARIGVGDNPPEDSCEALGQDRGQTTGDDRSPSMSEP